MKRAVGVVVGALVLLIAALLVRPKVDPLDSDSARVVPGKNEQELPSPGPSHPSEPRAPSTEATPVEQKDARQVVSDLVRALRSGNLDRARLLLTDLRDILLPPIPDDENAALLYAKALPLMDLLPPDGEGRKAYDTILRGEKPSPEGIALLKKWLAKHSERLVEGSRLLHEAAARPHCRFIPESLHSLGPGTKTILQMTSASNLLSVQAYLAHREGRKAEAGEIARTAWALSQNGRTPPPIIYQMLGVGLENIVFDSIVRDGSIDHPDVASFLSNLDPSYGSQAWKRSLLGEIYFASSTLLDTEGTPADVSFLPNYIESYVEVLALPPSRYEEEKLLLEALGRKYGEDSPLKDDRDVMFTALSQLRRAMMASEVRRAVFQVAVEVERYRSRRGAYPETLDALGVSLPVDPLTGGSFDYRLEGGRILIQTSSNFRDRENTAWRSKP